MTSNLVRFAAIAILAPAVSGYDGSCGGTINSGDLANKKITVEEIADVSGVVTDAITDLPVAAATVRIEDRADTTDVSGMFFISEVNTGSQIVTITAAGYHPFSTTLELVAGANAVGPLLLTPEGVQPPGGWQELRILFVVDRSNSMSVTDPYNQRITAVADAIQALTTDGATGPLQTNVRVAIASFWGDVVVHTHGPDSEPGFTDDTTALLASLPQLAQTSSNTGYDKALSTVHSLIAHDVGLLAAPRRAGTLYQVVFISDGTPFPDNCPGESNSIANAVATVEAIDEYATKHGVMFEFHTVAILAAGMYDLALTLSDCVDPFGAGHLPNLGALLEVTLGSMATAGGGMFLGSIDGPVTFAGIDIGWDPEFDAGSDRDGDGVADGSDFCPRQWENDAFAADWDTDGIGDACDLDRDGDTTDNVADNCPWAANDQTDTDGDGVGDLCDEDSDGDTVADGSDNCPAIANMMQINTDGDSQGDACDPDDDGDGIADTVDACRLVSGQTPGPGCEDDADGDGIDTAADNCPYVYNPLQGDHDSDGTGNACDADFDPGTPFADDFDSDGIEDEYDNCPFISNFGQGDVDGDGQGDACDPDADGDSVDNVLDNCWLVANSMQEDLDCDGLGDACDDDDDGDTVADGTDNCPDDPNIGQVNTDGDAMGDVCDPDDDNDGIDDILDDCRLGTLGADICDDDADGDGIPGSDDNCPGIFNPQLGTGGEQLDIDQDGVGDICDPDRDGDAWANCLDNCSDVYNPNQVDTDGDGVGDLCDPV